MELCDKMKKQFIFIILVLLLLSGVLAVETQEKEIFVSKSLSNVDYNIDQEARTVTYNFSAVGGAVKLGEDNYWDIKPAVGETRAYIKTDEHGTIIQAELTASKETSWKFGNQTLKVPEGARVVFKKGKLEILGKEGQEIGLTYSSSGVELKKNVKLGPNLVYIQDRIISGNNFEVDGIKVQIGSLLLDKGGYLLGKESAANWKGLTLSNDNDLFLATSFDETKNHANWVFPEESRLRGKGDGFEINFNKENTFAKVELEDTFVIKAEGCNIDILNRGKDGKIPKLDLDGKWKIVEDGKVLSLDNNEDLIIKRFDKNDYINLQYRQKTAEELKIDEMTIAHMKSSGIPEGDIEFFRSRFSKPVEISGASSLNDDSVNKFTSPIELFINDIPSSNDKKILITNFGGFSEISRTAEIAKEQIANSVYYKTMSNTLTYNYPDISQFQKIIGKTLNFDYSKDGDVNLQSPLYNPLFFREFMDYWETLPDNVRKEVSVINIYDTSTYLSKVGFSEAAYMNTDHSLNFKIENGVLTSDFETFRHEMIHLSHDNINGIENTLLSSRVSENGAEFQQLLMQDRAVGIYKAQMMRADNLDTEEKIEKTKEYIQKNFPNYDQLLNKYNKPENLNLAPKSDFTKEWLNLVGKNEAYGKFAKIDPYIGAYWNDLLTGDDPQNSKPRYGFISPYGSTDFNEDIATFSAKVISDPAFFERNKLLGEGADPIYKNKLELLKNYKVITQQEYDTVMQTAGLK